MFSLFFREAYDKTFSKIRDNELRKQIHKKVSELKENAPLGKKLVGNPFWSIHVGRYRVIYLLDRANSTIELVDILEREKEYRELR